MKRYLNLFTKAVLAGIYIAIAGAVYLVVSNSIGGAVGTVVGATLFSIGLLTICVKGYYLYTGKVGYLLPYDKEMDITVILTTILGNMFGIVVMGLLMNIINIPGLEINAKLAIVNKFGNTWYVSLVSSFFCGMLMYTGVDGYGKMKDNLAKVLIVFLSVIVFLSLGFDHSIANIAYLIYAKEFSFKILGLLIVMIIGNGLGAVMLNMLHTLVDKTKKDIE